MNKFFSKIALLISFYLSFNSAYNLCQTFIFAHGYGGDENQYLHYKQKNWSILPGDKVLSFNFPEVNAGGLRVNNAVVNFGQEGDIQAIKRSVDSVLAKNPNEEIVLVGVSRGASAIINYASLYPKNIKALVLEAPFDDFLNIVDNLVSGYRVGWIPGVKQTGRFFACKKFPSYNPDGLTPLKSLEDLHKHAIPTLFIHSYEDALISISASLNLYNNLLLNQKNVHIIKLLYGRHANYMSGADKHRYQKAVHLFYKKYNIIYNKKIINNIILEQLEG